MADDTADDSADDSPDDSAGSNPGSGADGRGVARSPGARMHALGTTRGKVVLAGLLTLLVLAGAVAIAVNAGGEAAAPPSTTTSAPATTTTSPAGPVYPLTGLPATGPAVAARPALVVKIDNAEPDSRPQIGLNQADVVYEERVEGAVTRFMAVFHSRDAQPVGPVRSARTSDIGLFSAFGKPLFAWSGANATFAERIRAASMVDVGHDAAPGLYRRSDQREAPYNLMLDGTAAVWSGDHPGATPPAPLFAYRSDGEEATGGRPTTGVHIVFGTEAGSAPVDYRWDGTGWARSQAGTPHVDALGEQVAPENVVVSYTPYAPSDANDQFGVPIREAQTVGEGEALVLTAGRAYTARWVKESIDAPTRYLDGDGNPIELTPGRTWVALPEPGSTTFLP